MAKPILLDAPNRDPKVELRHRLENAPAEHAEALLAAYEVLQGLHDRGLLETHARLHSDRATRSWRSRSKSRNGRDRSAACETCSS